MLTHLKFKSNFCDDPFLGFLLGKVPTVFKCARPLPSPDPPAWHPPPWTLSRLGCPLSAPDLSPSFLSSPLDADGRPAGRLTAFLGDSWSTHSQAPALLPAAQVRAYLVPAPPLPRALSLSLSHPHPVFGKVAPPSTFRSGLHTPSTFPTTIVFCQHGWKGLLYQSFH